MRRWLRDLVGSTLSQVLAGFAATATVAIWAVRGDARSWLVRVPQPVWSGLIGAAALALVLSGWKMARPRRRALSVPYVRVTRSSPWGYGQFEVPYSDVVWYCRLPQPGPVVRSWAGADADEVRVERRPRCPRCKTELEERPRRLWSGYTWLCVSPGCAFTLRTQDSFAQTIERVEKIARRRVEDFISAERAKADPGQQGVPY